MIGVDYSPNRNALCNRYNFKWASESGLTWSKLLFVCVWMRRFAICPADGETFTVRLHNIKTKRITKFKKKKKKPQQQRENDLLVALVIVVRLAFAHFVCIRLFLCRASSLVRRAASHLLVFAHTLKTATVRIFLFHVRSLSRDRALLTCVLVMFSCNQVIVFFYSHLRIELLVTRPHPFLHK